MTDRDLYDHEAMRRHWIAIEAMFHRQLAVSAS